MNMEAHAFTTDLEAHAVTIDLEAHAVTMDVCVSKHVQLILTWKAMQLPWI